MPRKPNYNYEKRRKEDAKKKRKAEKQQRKRFEKDQTSTSATEVDEPVSPAPTGAKQDLDPQ